MPRPLWKGVISFGLVTIPVSLYAARAAGGEVVFKTLDRVHLQPVHERRFDIEQKEVAFEDTVKGFEYEKDRFVVVGAEDFQAANVQATQSIDIMHFVEGAAIDLVYFDTPYYVEPLKTGRKAYALLRETLKRTGKVGIGRVVIRTRQHLCALKADGPLIVVDLLRWSHELRGPEEFDLPGEDLDQLGVSPQELQMAEQLVTAMAAEWDPTQYRDTYREDLLRLIEEKVAKGEITEGVPAPAPEEPEGGQVVDIMALLKRSVEQRKQQEPPAAGAKPAPEGRAARGKRRAAKEA